MADTTHPDVNPEGVDVETCLQQLRDPAVILAEALYRVHQADAAQAEIDAMPPFGYAEDRVRADLLGIQRDHLTDTADTLSYIAKAAADMAHQERQGQAVFTAEQFDRLDAESDRAYEPQAVNGVRFTADITCRYMGRVGDALWAYVQGVGFLRVSGAASIDTVTVGMTVGVQFGGRVVSATPDHVLCITDGGTAVTLPRALIDESADE